MPLPSVLNGAKQCQVLTKRTKQRCKNPCAFGSKKACRMHGSHRSKNVLRGAAHPNHKHGDRTKEAESRQSRASAILLTLRDIGDSIGMFTGTHSRGRKPKAYRKYNMSDLEQLALAIIAISQKWQKQD